jgi:hypothetical protein
VKKKIKEILTSFIQQLKKLFLPSHEAIYLSSESHQDTFGLVDVLLKGPFIDGIIDADQGNLNLLVSLAPDDRFLLG